mgnify:CR=1 FL=1
MASKVVAVVGVAVAVAVVVVGSVAAAVGVVVVVDVGAAAMRRVLHTCVARVHQDGARAHVALLHGVDDVVAQGGRQVTEGGQHLVQLLCDKLDVRC